MALFRDKGYWYLVRPKSSRKTYVDAYNDETGEVIEPPVVTENVGMETREPDIPWDAFPPHDITKRRFACWGPYNHSQYGWMYVVKLPVDIGADDIQGVRNVTANQLRNLLRQNNLTPEILKSYGEGERDGG